LAPYSKKFLKVQLQTNYTNPKIDTIRFEKNVFFELSFIFGLMLLPRAMTYVLFFYFLFKIFSKKVWLSKVLFYGFLLRLSNVAIFHRYIFVSWASWLILFIVFFRSLILGKPFKNSNNVYIAGAILFIFCALISSVIKSDFIILSLFKLLSFGVGFFAIYFSLIINRNYNWKSFLFTTWSWFIVVSLPTLFIPQIGRALNVERGGFQGVLGHPQALGFFLAPLTTYFGYHILFTNKIAGRYYILQILLVLSCLFVVLSKARTAVFSIAICGVIFTVSGVVRNVNKYKRVKLKQYYLFVLLVFIIVFIVRYNTIMPSVLSFVVKRGQDLNTLQNIEMIGSRNLIESRELLIIDSFNNFKKNVFIGIGFGVPSNQEKLNVTYLPGTQIPISGANEKGNLISALLEEVGLIGFFVFFFWVLQTLKHLRVKENIEFILFASTSLILNLGEMAIFSINAYGSYVWFIISFCYLESRKNSATSVHPV